MYPFLPPRRSPGLILSLDYSFQMHEKYNNAMEKNSAQTFEVRPLSPPKKQTFHFFCCCLLATWVCAPAPTSPSPAWLHAWTGLTRRAPRVLLTDSELSQPPTSSGAGLAPAGV